MRVGWADCLVTEAVLAATRALEERDTEMAAAVKGAGEAAEWKAEAVTSVASMVTVRLEEDWREAALAMAPTAEVTEMEAVWVAMAAPTEALEAEGWGVAATAMALREVVVVAETLEDSAVAVQAMVAAVVQMAAGTPSRSSAR
jgi:hypothetical protein